MKKLIEEFRYFIREIRLGFPRQEKNDRFYRKFWPLMALELKSYSKAECLAFAIELSVSDIDQVGKLYMQLTCRVGRGKTTLEEVKKICS